MLPGMERAGPLTSCPVGTRALLAPCPVLAKLNQTSLPPEKSRTAEKVSHPPGRRRKAPPSLFLSLFRQAKSKASCHIGLFPALGPCQTIPETHRNSQQRKTSWGWLCLRLSGETQDSGHDA